MIDLADHCRSDSGISSSNSSTLEYSTPSAPVQPAMNRSAPPLVKPKPSINLANRFAASKPTTGDIVASPASSSGSSSARQHTTMRSVRFAVDQSPKHDATIDDTTSDSTLSSWSSATGQLQSTMSTTAERPSRLMLKKNTPPPDDPTPTDVLASPRDHADDSPVHAYYYTIDAAAAQSQAGARAVRRLGHMQQQGIVEVGVHHAAHNGDMREDTSIMAKPATSRYRQRQPPTYEAALNSIRQTRNMYSGATALQVYL